MRSRRELHFLRGTPDFPIGRFSDIPIIGCLTPDFAMKRVTISAVVGLGPG
jgi:hypothetical protein